jgi:hypothetical protein
MPSEKSTGLIDEERRGYEDGSKKRRRARRTALILGFIALAFYIGIFLSMHYLH